MYYSFNILSYLCNKINNYFNNREEFSDYSTIFIVYINISVIISLFAAYVSWKCSWKIDQIPSTLQKILFSFLAFIFGPLYLVYAYLVGHFPCSLF